MIRTIVRDSERNGGLLSFKVYKKMVAKRRGVTLSNDNYLCQMRRNWKKRKPREQKIEEREKAFVKEEKRNTSIWQKVKNLFSGK